VLRPPLIAILVFVGFLLLPAPAQADSNAVVAAQLSNYDVYITNNALPAGAVQQGDLKRLQQQVDAAASRNVDEKIAIISTYPTHFHNITEAAASLQNFLDYSGVLILVSPRGMGISSDQISGKTATRIVRESSPACRRSYTACALLAGKLAIPAVRSAKNSAFHNALVLIAASVAGLAAITAVLAFAIFRRRQIAAPIPT